ncbi:hypothetical protein FSP39_014865 [Pinctada imbricata]|uniref:XPG-I domain-containing protein n=1 Tax=Pinctada imbricata TaxID=66713 RepID=A0AA88YDM9_PINIB|nr:hypothetical protein FSP39_014865 [Pinctada imbricata]
MCAALNAAGMVDGSITNDGDAFLHGAHQVYRNFNLSSKDPHVECFSMDDIEEKLSLDRSKLVAMALLLGKGRSVPDFTQTKVISKFFDVKDKCPKKIQSWKRSQLVRLQNYALRKLEWPEEYTEEKILPLLTLWDLLDISRGNTLVQHLAPYRIVKKRPRQGKNPNKTGRNVGNH